MCQLINDTNTCQSQGVKNKNDTVNPVMKVKKIHEILRDKREDNQLTQLQIADYLEIGRTMYKRYETGETDIPIRHLKKLCTLYQISADNVIGLKISKDQQKGTIKMTHEATVEKCRERVIEILAWAEEQRFPTNEVFDILTKNIEEAMDEIKKKI